MINKKRNYLPYIFIILFIGFSIIFPLSKLFLTLDIKSISRIFSSKQFIDAINNSLFTTLISTTISITIAYLLAYSIHRTKIKHKQLLTVLLTLPMLIPSISHGLGLINLFGKNGIFTNILNIDFKILGLNGIILGSILYSFPTAFLMISDAFNYIDNSMYECAEVLGMNKFQVFTKITLHYLKKPLISAFLTTFTLIFTDYGVPLAVGGRYMVLPLYLYREVIGLLDFSKGTIIGILLLIPSLIAFILDLILKNDSTVNFNNKEYNIKENKIRDIIFTIFDYLIIIFLFTLYLSFIYLSFMKQYPYVKDFSLLHYEYMFQNNIIKILFNSIIISILVSLIGTIIAYTSAYITSRTNIKYKSILHILIIITMAIPGIVLGLSYMLYFKDSFIYRTFTLLIMVNIVHFIATPYLMAYNALNKVNKNYEVIGETCGISNYHIIKDVIIPNTKDTILEIGSYFFVNSMVTISAITFLYSSKTMPLSLLINQYESQMMFEEAAIISVVILIINLIVKLTIYLTKKYFIKGRAKHAINI